MSAEQPIALKPGEEFTLEYDLHFTSWVFPKGHRIRVAVNNAMWPMIWPTPYPMTTTLRVDGAGSSRVELPIIPQSHEDAPAFEPIGEDPELPGYGSVPQEDDTASGYAEVKHIERLPLTATTVIRMPSDGGSIYPWATIYYSENLIHEANDDDPARASALGETSYRIVQGDRELIFSGNLSLRSDSEFFYYEYTRRLTENGEPLRERTWTEKIPRNHH